MPDIELKQNHPGGALAGDCGRIDHENNNGTVNITITRRNCQQILDLPVFFVPKEMLKDCHCDE